VTTTLEDNPSTTSPAAGAPADLNAPAPPAVRVTQLVKTYDERPILRGLNFALPRGQYVALMGANGAGKSTLLNLLSLLTTPTSGNVELFGESGRQGGVQLRRRIGVVAHQPMLYRDLSARENLMFFARLYGLERPQQRVNELLDRVRLADRANDLARTFSRGMVQRLAIARALVHDPQLILADEPFSGLDVPSSRMLEDLLASLHAENRTILLANHDVDQTLRLAQRLIILRRGQVALDDAVQNLNAPRVLEELKS
jgi:heme exporter protein A